MLHSDSELGLEKSRKITRVLIVQSCLFDAFEEDCISAVGRVNTDADVADLKVSRNTMWVRHSETIAEQSTSATLEQLYLLQKYRVKVSWHF